MNHEYRKIIVNESWIIWVKKAGMTSIESQMIPLPPPNDTKEITNLGLFA